MISLTINLIFGVLKISLTINLVFSVLILSLTINWGIFTSGLSWTGSTSIFHCSCSSLVVLETEMMDLHESSMIWTLLWDWGKSDNTPLKSGIFWRHICCLKKGQLERGLTDWYYSLTRSCKHVDARMQQEVRPIFVNMLWIVFSQSPQNEAKNFPFSMKTKWQFPWIAKSWIYWPSHCFMNVFSK